MSAAFDAVRARPLALAGGACVAGVLVGAAVPWVALAGLAPLLWKRFRAEAAAWICWAAFGAGTMAGAAAQRSLETRLSRGEPPASIRGPVEVRLTVRRTGWDPIRGQGWLVGHHAGGRTWLCVWAGRYANGAAPGAVVRVAGRTRPVRRPTNPGERDRRRALAGRGIDGILDLRDARNVKVLHPAPGRWSGWLEGTRRRAASRLSRVLEPPDAALGMALLLGIRSAVDESDRRLFRTTGTTHLLAISGLHVLLLAATLNRVLRRVGFGPRSAAACTLLAAGVYVPFTGGAPPIRRAVGGLFFYGAALLLGRVPDVATAIGGTALVMALSDPLQVHTLGFQLSFVATIGIANLGRAWSVRWSRRHTLLVRFPATRRRRRLLEPLLRLWHRGPPISLAAWVSTAAVIAHVFGRAHPYAAVTNVMVAPLVAVALPSLALVAAGAPAAWFATTILGAWRGLLGAAAGLPGGVLRMVPPPIGVVVLWQAAWWFSRFGIRWSLLLGGAALLALLTRNHPAPTPSGLWLLDVGHGQAAVLRFPSGATFLVDGGTRGRRALGRRVLVPALRALGVRELHGVICSHGDADHWQGLLDVVADIPTRRLWLGPDPPPSLLAVARQWSVPIDRVGTRRTIWRELEGELQIVEATGPARGTPNDRSLVLRARIRGRTFLLPADREEEGLRHLLERPGDLRSDVLVAPHHGARCDPALARAFGSRARPRFLLVSAGPGFSDARTIEAYAATLVLATYGSGCIAATVDSGGRLSVEGHLHR